MSESLAKQITEKVFDLDKVGVGDVVEFPSSRIQRCNKLNTRRRAAGIVMFANRNGLTVSTHIPGINADITQDLGAEEIGVKDADEVRLLFRSYHNAKGTEEDTYGRRD